VSSPSTTSIRHPIHRLALLEHPYGDHIRVPPLIMALPTPEQVAASQDVLYECVMGGSRIVGIGNGVVVKYGPRVQSTEADSLAFVGAHTTLPTPKVLGTYKHNDITYIVMTRLPGKPLVGLLSAMSLPEINVITSDLKSMMDELRDLRIRNFETGSYIGSVGHQPCRDMLFILGDESKGPFQTEEEMYENIIERWVNRFEMNPLLDSSVEFTRRLYRDTSGNDIVFTHGDLDPRNILVENGRVCGIVDWEQAGWYPEYWEYIKTMWGCVDTWETVWPLEVVQFLRPYDYIRLLDLQIRTALQ
jgi:Phosphotransferase enzyme family